MHAMQDSNPILLNNSPVGMAEPDNFCNNIIDLDAELGNNEKIRWLRRELFRLYNLYFGLDVDEFAPPSEIRGDSDDKEEATA